MVMQWYLVGFWPYYFEYEKYFLDDLRRLSPKKTITRQNAALAIIIISF